MLGRAEGSAIGRRRAVLSDAAHRAGCRRRHASGDIRVQRERRLPRLRMTPAPAPERRTLQWALLAAVSLAMIAVLVPFYGTLLWSVIIALLFTPMYRWLRPRVRGQRTVAALLTLAAVVLIVILPFSLLTVSLLNEAAALYERLQSAELNPAVHLRRLFDGLPPWAGRLLSGFGMTNFDELLAQLSELFSQAGQFIAAQALRIGQNTFELVASLFIMLYVAFFLIRDGDGVVRALRDALPLSEQEQRALSQKFATTIRATVKGNLLVAALQGALGGVAFWYLGITGALLWAVMMAFLSLLPAVGAALVWFPVAVYYLSTGALWQGLGLTVWGIVVIGLVDNLLRPVLVGKDTRLPDYVVLITTLGGMAVFGINGFVLGPVIAAMFIAVWHMVVMRRRLPADGSAPSAMSPPSA